MSESVEEVCDRTIEASQDILSFDLSVVDIEDGGMLRKQALSSDIPLENTTDMSVEEGIAGKTYRTGESFVIDDLAENDIAEPQGEFGSAISVPIGDHGVFQAVSESTDGFDETDLELTELLVNHTETALNRLEHNRQLERKNERLDEFAEVVSHDLRNPLNVAKMRRELLEDDCTSEHLTHLEGAHDRMERIIDDVLALARQGEVVSAPKPVTIKRLIEDCWTVVETKDATLVTDIDETILASESRLRQVFENLFRNAVEHGSTSPDPKGGQSVSAKGPRGEHVSRSRV